MHTKNASGCWEFRTVLVLAAMALPGLARAQAAPRGDTLKARVDTSVTARLGRAERVIQTLQQQTQRFAWINLQQVLQQAPGYTAAESTFTKEMKTFQGEVEKLQQQFDSTLNEYQKQSVVLSPSAKTAKEGQLKQMQQTLQQRANDLQTRAQQREQELVRPIEERVKGVIEGVRAERNIAMIFDASAQGSNIIAADRTLDLTSTVLQRLKVSQ